jgi:hypothetical protein
MATGMVHLREEEAREIDDAVNWWSVKKIFIDLETSCFILIGSAGEHALDMGRSDPSNTRSLIPIMLEWLKIC